MKVHPSFEYRDGERTLHAGTTRVVSVFPSLFQEGETMVTVEVDGIEQATTLSELKSASLNTSYAPELRLCYSQLVSDAHQFMLRSNYKSR